MTCKDSIITGTISPRNLIHHVSEGLKKKVLVAKRKQGKLRSKIDQDDHAIVIIIPYVNTPPIHASARCVCRFPPKQSPHKEYQLATNTVLTKMPETYNFPEGTFTSWKTPRMVRSMTSYNMLCMTGLWVAKVKIDKKYRYPPPFTDICHNMLHLKDLKLFCSLKNYKSLSGSKGPIIPNVENKETDKQSYYGNPKETEEMFIPVYNRPKKSILE